MTTINYININIKEGQERTPIDYDKKYFTDYHPRYSEKTGEKSRETIYFEKPLNKRFNTGSSGTGLFEKNQKDTIYKGIDGRDITINGLYAHLSLNQLVYAINKFSSNYYYYIFLNKKKGKKIKGHGLCILKVLLQGGIRPTKNAISTGSPFLFYDIDVKKHENPLLFSNKGMPNELNKNVFKFLKSISLLTTRSSSGQGICGILYCPFLEKIDDNKLHRQIGDAVYSFINENLNPPTQIQFDEAQAQFTQGRMFPVQLSNTINASWNTVELNKEALEFHIEDFELKTEDQVRPKKKNINNEANLSKKTFSINTDGYNSEYNSKELVKAFNNEYEQAGEENNRGYIPFQKIGKNNKSVNVHIKNNYFKCFTQSLKGSTPFDLYTQLSFNGDSKKAYENLISSDAVIHDKWDNDDFWLDSREPDTIRYTAEEINTILKNEHDFTDIYLNDKGEIESRKPEKKNMLGITDRTIVGSYHLNFKKFGYKYPIYDIIKDKNFTTNIVVGKYLTPNIIAKNCNAYLNYIYAPCGAGKTTTFLGNETHKIEGLAKDKKILFIVPRKNMVEQQCLNAFKKYKMIASTGDKHTKSYSNVEYISSIAKKTEKIKDNKGELRSIITTYDQLANLSNDIVAQYDYVVLDEAHLLSSDDYRKAIPDTFLKIEKLKKYNSVKFILLSATPSTEALIFKQYLKEHFNVINVEIKDAKKPVVYVNKIDGLSPAQKNALISNQILEDILKKRKVVVFCENKEKMIQHSNMLRNYLDSKCYSDCSIGIISSNSTGTDTYVKILEEESLNTEIIFTTSILNVGINITKGIENGMSFIFDFSSQFHHSLACGLLQLLYRNRKKNTIVHCYAEFISKNNEVFDNEREEYYLNNMRKHKVFIEQKGKKSCQFEDLNFKGIDEVSELYIATSEMEKRTKYAQKTIGSFINLATKNNCLIEYKYEISSGNTITGDNIKNKFVYKLLQELLKIDTYHSIQLKNTQKYDEKNVITTDVEINKTPELLEATTEFYNCKYNPSFKNLEGKVVRCFNYLKFIYKSKNDVRDVLNYILNVSSRKKLDEKLIDYVKRCKTIHENSLISRVTVFEVLALKNVNKNNIEHLIDTVIPNKVLSIFDNLILNKNYKLFKHEIFREAFSDYLKREVDKSFKSLFKISVQNEEKKKVTKIYSKRVLYFFNTNNHHTNITTIDDVLQKLKIDGTHIEREIFDTLINELSKDYKVDELDKFYIKDYQRTTDFFNDLNYTEELSLIQTSTDDLKTLKLNNPRLNFVYGIMDKQTGKVILSENLVVLHAKLAERGILKKMISIEGYDFTKLNNFKSKAKTNLC
ncbi:DEAD/DEAH box helicase, partial [Tenacibaculum maritimum]|uniref:DEAD/DEAH box helicase n=2 Tax=Tenacibaculum maritimum TaxID=107401 RepID=UPI0038761C31